MRAFVVAMECEAEQVRPFLGEGDVLVVSGIGKVNAAAAAQKAIDGGADEILNCGLVGGLDPAMSVGDVFEVSQAVEYDFDLAVLNGTGLGVHDERDTPYFDCAAKGAYPVRILASGVLVGALVKTGSAAKIADAIIAALGVRFALAAVALAALVVTAVGVFVDIAVITVAPVALAVGRKAVEDRVRELIRLLSSDGKA